MKKMRAPRAKRLPKVGRPIRRARTSPRRVFGHVTVFTAARVGKGLSVRALAFIVGITPASVSRIERGLQHPAPGTLTRIRRALRIR